jgi:hypothetical protein
MLQLATILLLAAFTNADNNNNGMAATLDDCSGAATAIECFATQLHWTTYSPPCGWCFSHGAAAQGACVPGDVGGPAAGEATTRCKDDSRDGDKEMPLTRWAYDTGAAERVAGENLDAAPAAHSVCGFAKNKGDCYTLDAAAAAVGAIDQAHCGWCGNYATGDADDGGVCVVGDATGPIEREYGTFLPPENELFAPVRSTGAPVCGADKGFQGGGKAWCGAAATYGDCFVLSSTGADCGWCVTTNDGDGGGDGDGACVRGNADGPTGEDRAQCSMPSVLKNKLTGWQFGKTWCSAAASVGDCYVMATSGCGWCGPPHGADENVGLSNVRGHVTLMV